MSDWAIAILPLLGVLLGAALQFWVSRASDQQKHTEDLRSQAYADYLRAVAAAECVRPTTSAYSTNPCEVRLLNALTHEPSELLVAVKLVTESLQPLAQSPKQMVDSDANW